MQVRLPVDVKNRTRAVLWFRIRLSLSPPDAALLLSSTMSRSRAMNLNPKPIKAFENP